MENYLQSEVWEIILKFEDEEIMRKMKKDVAFCHFIAIPIYSSSPICIRPPYLTYKLLPRVRVSIKTLSKSATWREINGTSNNITSTDAIMRARWDGRGDESTSFLLLLINSCILSPIPSVPRPAQVDKTFPIVMWLGTTLAYCICFIPTSVTLTKSSTAVPMARALTDTSTQHRNFTETSQKTIRFAITFLFVLHLQSISFSWVYITPSWFATIPSLSRR